MRIGIAGAGAAVVCAVVIAAAAAGPAQALPDGRAYEMVTPPDKAAPVFRANGLWMPSVDGNRFLWTALVPVADATTPLNYSAVASRGSTGWTSEQVAPTPVSPHPTGFLNNVNPGDVSDDLSMIVFDGVLDNFDPDDQTAQGTFLSPQDVYQRWIGGPMTLVSRGPDPHTASGSSTYSGRSADGQHVLFQTTNHVLPVDAGRVQGSGLYDRVGGETVAVDLADDGTMLNPCGASAGGPLTAQNAMSEDGARIFFESPARDSSGVPPCDIPRQVYVRADGETTTRISRSRLAVPEAPQPASFAGAAADGSKVLITSTERLVDAAPATATDKLYEYETSSDTLSFVVDGVEQLVKVARGGDHYALLAKDVLAPGAVDGAYNLYVKSPSGLTYVGDGDLVVQKETIAAAAFSPNGRYFAFATPGGASGWRLHLSDATTSDDPVCLSCPPPGVAESSQPPELIPRRGQEFSVRATLPDVVTDTGTVFFTSSDPLVDADTNGVKDVYEFADGQRQLISPGTGRNPSYLAGASRDGSSVFFSTTDSLVSADYDNGDEDVYVARVGGGFPEPPTPEPPCEGPECQGPESSAPTLSLPSSTALRGRGDVRPGPRAKASLRVPRSARLRLARRGRATVSVRVNRPGRVSLVARARLARRGAIVVGRSARTARRAGVVKLGLRLSRPARRHLARHDRLTVRLSVVFANQRQTLRLALADRRAR